MHSLNDNTRVEWNQIITGLLCQRLSCNSQVCEDKPARDLHQCDGPRRLGQRQYSRWGLPYLCLMKSCQIYKSQFQCFSTLPIIWAICGSCGTRLNNLQSPQSRLTKTAAWSHAQLMSACLKIHHHNVQKVTKACT